jgi:hypothetical protein
VRATRERTIDRALVRVTYVHRAKYLIHTTMNATLNVRKKLPNLLLRSFLLSLWMRFSRFLKIEMGIPTSSTSWASSQTCENFQHNAFPLNLTVNPSKQEVGSKNFQEIKEFYEENGHLTLPRVDKYSRLSNWLTYQRHGATSLRKDQLELLESIN